MAVEIMYARHPENTAKPLPPNSLINKAVKTNNAAPANAGNNLTKNSWYPNMLLTTKERKAIKGGVEANPHDK